MAHGWVAGLVRRWTADQVGGRADDYGLSGCVFAWRVGKWMTDGWTHVQTNE